VIASTTFQPEIYYNCADLVFSGGDGNCGQSYAAAPSVSFSTNTDSSTDPNLTSTQKQATAASSLSSSQQICTEGEYKCEGKRLGQCANGKWVLFDCAKGTECVETTQVARCDHPSKSEGVTETQSEQNAEVQQSDQSAEIQLSDSSETNVIYAVPCQTECTTVTVTTTTTVEVQCKPTFSIPTRKKRHDDVEFDL
jgi:hypothetical protein